MRRQAASGHEEEALTPGPRPARRFAGGPPTARAHGEVEEVLREEGKVGGGCTVRVAHPRGAPGSASMGSSR